MAKPGKDKSVAVRARVSGRVQGVFYRQTTQERARELGVMGWVRNEDDGSVLVHAEGPREAIEALAEFLQSGPPNARVEAAEVRAVKVEGHEQFAIRGVSAGEFVVLEGRGRGGRGREHLEEAGADDADDAGPSYELRLEVDGVMLAWAVPKEPSMDPAVKRMAIRAEVQDGPPGSESGPVWDRGPYEQGGRVAWPEAIERGHAVFVLHGERLRGGFALQRTGRGTNSRWLLIKRRDAEAVPFHPET